MKSYTDLEQSKKLAEILPLESADMYYEPSTGYCTEPSEVRFGDIKYAHPRSIRCWSLTALLNVLPDNYIDVDDTIQHPSLMKTKDSRYMVIYSALLYTSLYNNPVDACVSMIIKLKELNLL